MGAPLRVAVSFALFYGLIQWCEYMDKTGRPVNHDIRDLNAYINTFLLPAVVRESVRHEIAVYLRNVVGGTLLYHVVGGAWSLYIYSRPHLFKGQKVPTSADIIDQISVAQVSIISYAMLPSLAAVFAERKFSLSYAHISEVGVPFYLAYLVLYLALVEIGIYWMHRELHMVKFLYRHIHAMHHKYNSASTLSPYASLAFHPLDGILQACPYVIFTFFVPTHYFTSLVLFFFTGVWATNIHDALTFRSEPLMGAGYHTDHHVFYHCNYGQFFTFCDKFWGTLRVPKLPAAKA